MKVYAPDDRAGVQKLLEKYRKQKEKLLAEKERLAKMRQYEEKYADRALSVELTRWEGDHLRVRWLQEP